MALVAGTLGLGGAEKQFVYMARTLANAGVVVRVFSLTQGEHYEDECRRMGITPEWIGRRASPVLRVIALARALRRFRPHVVQSGHFYTNLHVSAVAMLYGALGLGAIRSHTSYDMAATGGWGRWLLRAPHGLLVNSEAAKRAAEALGVEAARIHVVRNVIDLAAFDRLAGDVPAQLHNDDRVVVAAVAAHIPVKRLDRFLAAVAVARQQMPSLTGMLIGAGPERERLEALASELGLLPEGVRFLGQQNDVPRLLRDVDVLVMSSDHEGFPNVILEAMAASLPVVTTPAGDAADVVLDAVTGYVVGFDDVHQLASRIEQLARSPQLREAFGRAGRERARAVFGLDHLAGSLLKCYRAIAKTSRHHRMLDLIPSEPSGE